MLLIYRINIFVFKYWDLDVKSDIINNTLKQIIYLMNFYRDGSVSVLG